MAIARVSYQWNDAAINAGGMNEARKLIAQVTRATYNRANVLTPVRTGRLRVGNSFRLYETGLVARGDVFNNTSYAAAVHNGAGPRRIYAKSRPVRGGGALRFEVGGRVIYRKWVDWPGSKGKPWLAQAMLQVAPRYGFRVTNADGI